MRAPTHITGPDGTLCRQGEEIPADWFDQLPDLHDHLDEIGESEGVTEVPADGTPVKATATVRRRRQSGPEA